MDIKCKVTGQKLEIVTPIRHFPRSSEKFVRFLFTFTEDWDGLLTFAQFRQGGNYTNRYLDTVTVTEDGVTSTYPAVTLPGWPKPGPLTMTLYGTGNGTVIGTTNFVMLHVDHTGLIEDAETSDMDETLYQQLVNRLIADHITFENAIKNNATQLSIKDIAGKAMAHRGYGWDSSNDNVHLPFICQNTIKAYQLAKDNGYQIIELDLQKDFNDTICIFHDTSIDNLTTGTGFFKDCDHSTLLLKDGDGVVTEETICTFEQACKWATYNNIILCPEIKIGANTKSATVDEIVAIAEKYSTKIIINCGASNTLLSECSTKYPYLWKVTTAYGSVEITKNIIDNLLANGHKNILIYNSIGGVADVNNGEMEKYAYQHDVLLCKTVPAFSNVKRSGYGVLFCVGYGRPNCLSPIVYDSGWIEVSDEDLINGYSTVSNSWRLRYRRIGNVVYVRALFFKSDWSEADFSDPSARRAYKLPDLFTPAFSYREYSSAGDSLKGSIMGEIDSYGNINPIFRKSGITIEELNSAYLPLFAEYPVENIKG